MGEQVVGRRERKKRATHAALSEAALRLCSEHGLDNVTVERIAEEADVALRTFFNYFSSKEEAVVAGDAADAAALVEAFRERPEHEPVVEALRHAVHSVLGADGYQERAARVHALRQSESLLPFQIAALVQQEKALAHAVSVRAGSGPAPDLYPALVAAGTMAGLRVAVHHWISESGTPAPPALAALADAALAQFAAGLAVRTPAPLAGSRPGSA